MLSFIGTAIATLVAGDTWVLRFNDSDHPNNIWTASIVFSRQGAQLFAKAGAVDGGDFLFTITAAESATITPGFTNVDIVFTQGIIRESEFAGDITVLPNPTGTMPATPNQQALTAVLATITIILGQPEATASFNGESYTLQNIDTLYKIRNQLIVDVNAELRSLGLTTRGKARTILTRFR